MHHLLLYILAAFIFLCLAYAAVVSKKEKEHQAARRFIFLGFLGPLPWLAAAAFSAPWQLSVFLILLLLLPVAWFFHPRRHPVAEGIVPKGKIDERDTMFSREQLEEGTDRYRSYYRSNPDKEKGDAIFRRNPGLLDKKSLYFDPLVFSSARANFDLIEQNRPFVDGAVARERAEVDSGSLTMFLKKLAKQYGAVSAGVTLLQDYHLYSHRGRRHNYGDPVVNDHTCALALTVEMDHDQTRRAPYAPVVLESSRQYVRSGMLALWLAQILRDLGFSARAHIDGEYEVVCPLVGRDAGLGEIGRMGLLMTPELGPRVRIAVVTTSAPLVVDGRNEDPSVNDFCARCKKCAEVCPSQAIPFENRWMINGSLRWQIDQQACFTYWTRSGTDCARCMSVCPYSHPDNPMHNLVRYGIRQSGAFRQLAVWMDDFIYGRRPLPLQKRKD